MPPDPTKDPSTDATALREELRVLASSLRPFPSFLGRGWVEAVEIEPRGEATWQGRGCVVVCPDGGLYELILRLVPGAEVVSDPDPVEELVPLELADAEYVTWARAAINSLASLWGKGS